ncbi:hypothetical protein CU669_03350 [Paramagnetospirillum kuznetsovii]|uniref:DUF1640 domain-containing protein n=1 Tax=Paramagnetospirillum kuznetsovii TaxID=2053833 RepID=A0A364P1I6_9PROT|nr:hypothetical protein [Paramagnetospirillum kuznetsovii]RAU23208.1 hypothetical protein CU669_03350 [Paramagnetospirillum kuznetsovii]
MSSVTFDKLAYLETLKASGVPEDQARAHASALDAALHDSVVTQSVLQTELQPMRTDIAVLKWMLGFNLAATMGIVMLLLRH